MLDLRIAAAITVLALANPALAQQKMPVQFAKGASSATVKGTIKGDQFRDYQVNARAGQTMSVTLSNPDGRAFFNVMAPGSTGEAVFIGSSDGNRFSGPVPGSGNTTVRVYQMRATARRGEVANYTLTVGVSGGTAAAGSPPKAGYSDLVGTDAIKAIDTLGARGFRSVDNFQSGADGLGSVWWNPRTRQCLQMITVNGRVDSLLDSKSQPNCR